MKKRLAVVILVIIALLVTSTSFAYFHGGRTDSNGGHKDNKNKSGLGSYHYHCGGNPPHLHDGGVCPYAPKASTISTNAKVDLVKLAQEELNSLGYECGTPDGSIGSKTKGAIKAFQKDNNLVVDGKLGPKTLAALGVK